MGVQFDPIKGLTNAHLGAYWSQLRKEWPKVQDVPRLESQFEVFGQEQTWSLLGAKFSLSQDLSTRLQIRNEPEDRMIQVQNSRFHYNWLDKKSEYPRYDSKIKPEFVTQWDRFLRFLASSNFAIPKLNQWEVTYVNHIPKGSVWNHPSDWVEVFPGLIGKPSAERIGNFESVGGQWHFEIPSEQGRLHVQIIHGRPVSPGAVEVVRLDLTARGPITGDPMPEGLIAGLDLGRTTIVRMFVALTSKRAQEFWGIHHA